MNKAKVFVLTILATLWTVYVVSPLFGNAWSSNTDINRVYFVGVFLGTMTVLFWHTIINLWKE